MFDGLLPEIADLASLTDAQLVDAAGGWSRVENAAGARKLAVMAEIFTRRTGLPRDERELWWIDPEAAVAAELAAALGVSTGLALHQTYRGVALRDRLPKVAALYEQGLISDLLVRVIVWRTYLIDDDEAMAAVDAELAARVRRWGALSAAKTEIAIDALVDKHDPDALRRSRTSKSGETAEFGSPTDPPGTTSLWARLNSPDASLMEQRVEQIAHSVCEGDGRTLNQRRAHALAAAVTGTSFTCRCADPDCTGGTPGNTPDKNAVIYAIADEKSVATAATSAEAAGASAGCAAPPAYVFGAGILPTALLGAIVHRATIRQVRHPGANSPPEPRYTPSRQLVEFVRSRDLTCRYPGCDKPAQVCQIDHTVPYPVGPTHPSNTKCLCVFHHLLKTFWVGRNGWSEKQLPDGTVIWTLPTGHTRITHPGSLYLFPQLCAPTATLWTGEPPIVQPSAGRGMKMPTRQRTRAAATAAAKAAERKLNQTQPPPAQIAMPPAAEVVQPWKDYFTNWPTGDPPGGDDPPPF